MAADPSEKTIWGEVDRSRHQAGWSCLVLVFVIGLLFIGLFWYAVNAGWLPFGH